jgi:predicted lipoprotein with Yx(FWY)xxD motif
MRRLRGSFAVALSAVVLGFAGMTARANVGTAEYWQPQGSSDREGYLPEPLPAGVQIVQTELDGAVYADANGHTLYHWQLKNLRNGDTGDRKKSGVSSCTDEVLKVTSGMQSPYPPGYTLPEADTRPSCAKLWPPFVAPGDAKPAGKWTIIARKDGTKQWVYDDYPVYTSSLDHRQGDVLGGTKIEKAGGSGVVRTPIGPPPDIPPELTMVAFGTGHMLVDHKGYSVYYSDADGPNKSNCDAKCLQKWKPVEAPDIATARGEWSIVVLSSGIKQWAFRKHLLYTYTPDLHSHSLIGSDVPGWHNVYTQRALPPPSSFTVQDSRIGQVLADANGKTVYVYNCSDDALDQQSCDNPDAPQEYRLAICGNGDPQVCRDTFPYLAAKPGDKSESRLWTVMAIDPNTGHRAAANQSDAVYVWAYRARPVYTYVNDHKPGDANGDAFGEFNGYRNGFKAFWLRDDFLDNAFRR